MLFMAVGVAWAGEWKPGGSLDVYTAFPTDVGVRGLFEGPGRVRLSASVGLLPDGYLDAINTVAVDAGWYDDRTAEVIDTALDGAAVARVHLGWRPFPAHGFFAEAGYGWIGLGGGVTAADVIYADTGYDLSDYLGDALPFDASADLHRAEVALGWELVFVEHLLVRFDLGYSYTVSAETRIRHAFDVPFFLEGSVEDLEENAEDELRRTLEEHVHTPIIGVGAGWRF